MFRGVKKQMTSRINEIKEIIADNGSLEKLVDNKDEAS